MNTKTILTIATLLLVVFTFGAFAQQYSYDYKNMKMDEYNAELGKWQKRLADAQAAIAEEEASIAKLQEDITAADDEYASTWNDIYTMLGTDETGYQSYLGQCKTLEDDINAFGALSAEDIYSRRGELEDLKARMAELKANKLSLGPEPWATLSRIEQAIADAEEKAQPAAAGKYEVVRGDYLWKIAKMPDIYSDPYAWIRIYSANRGQIKNPDLIYPAQIFDIPRIAGPNEHWVTRGESLTDIAKNMGNAFTWQRIYEANKDLIGEDPNVIYPHMVLSVPR